MLNSKVSNNSAAVTAPVTSAAVKPVTAKPAKKRAVLTAAEKSARAAKAKITRAANAAKKAAEKAALIEANLTPAEKLARGRARQAITQGSSMALAENIRNLVNVETGAVFKNCNTAYKAGLFSSSQCDTLSGKLLKAAKLSPPVYAPVVINGQTWVLAGGYKAPKKAAKKRAPKKAAKKAAKK